MKNFFNNLTPLKKILLLVLVVLVLIVVVFTFVRSRLPQNENNLINNIQNSFNSNLNQIGVTIPNEIVKVSNESMIEGKSLDLSSDLGYLSQYYVSTIDDKWLISVPNTAYSDPEFDKYINQLPEFLFDNKERGSDHLYLFDQKNSTFEYLDFDTFFFDEINTRAGKTLVKLKYDNFIVESGDKTVTLTSSDFENTLPVSAKKIPNTNNEYFVLGMSIDADKNTQFNLSKIKLSDFNLDKSSINVTNYNISDFFINELRLTGLGEVLSGIVSDPNADLQDQFIETVVPQLEMQVLSSNRIFFKSEYFDLNYRVFEFEIESNLLKFTKTFSFDLKDNFDISCFEDSCLLYSRENLENSQKPQLYVLKNNLEFEKYSISNKILTSQPYQAIKINNQTIIHFENTALTFDNI